MAAGSDRLVRLVVLGGAFLAVSAFAVAFAFSASPAVNVDPDYIGARILPPGPAQNGLPMIPVRVDEAGFLIGVPSHLSWYRYCNAGLGALEPERRSTNRFVFDQLDGKLEQARVQGMDLWYEERLGDAARPEHFSEFWQGAPVSWRSEGETDDGQVLRAVLIKIDPSVYSERIRKEFAPDGFAAFFAGSTFFCCNVGWEDNNNPKARFDDGFPLLYDPCHDARYDIRDIRTYDYPPGDERLR